MADTQELERDVPDTEEPEAAPAVLSAEWIDRIEGLLTSDRTDELRELVEPLPPADVADLHQQPAFPHRVFVGDDNAPVFAVIPTDFGHTATFSLKEPCALRDSVKFCLNEPR